MRRDAIWVLITDGAQARVCSTAGGLAMPLNMPARALQGGAHRFARGLADFLRDAGAEGAYARLIVIASPLVAEELDDALQPETRARLIGQVIRDAETGDIPKTHVSELRH